MEVPFDIYILYMYQLGFYVHSMYATFYMDTIRNDFLMMILHHFVTIFLIFFSYSVRCHRMGMLVLFCHDLTDVFLEAAKIFNYTKERNGKSHLLNEIIANVLFVLFAISWVILRMYWYPLKVLYGGGCYGNSKVPLLTTMNVLIWMLQFLNIYWFWLIVKMVFKVLFGKETSFRDTREDQIEAREKEEERLEKLKEKSKQNNDVHVPNGVDGVSQAPRQRIKTPKAD
ncbi:ceramide synthase 1-like [Ptychodera flava]|uniref:ceramide synthase 1-like n=1 Tax=Ptychodera flava TaxID=63121 RepID=UPI00396A8EEB